jgi:hypothetical protein
MVLPLSLSLNAQKTLLGFIFIDINFSKNFSPFPEMNLKVGLFA